MVGVVAVIALSAALVGASPASAAEPVKVLRTQADPLAAPKLDADWVASPARYPLRYRTIAVLHGSRVGLAGCEWTIPIIVRAAGLAIDYRSRATRARTCEALVEFGVPPTSQLTGANRVALDRWHDSRVRTSRTDDVIYKVRDCEAFGDEDACVEYCDVPDTQAAYYPCGARAEKDSPNDRPGGEILPYHATDTESLADTTSEPFVDAGAGAEYEPRPTGRSTEAATKSFSAGYLESWYEDPVGIDVTKVKNTASGWHDGKCMRNPKTNGLASYDWYTTSGWGKVSSNLNEGTHCAYSWSSSYAKYKNGIFCRVIGGVVPGVPFGKTTYNTYNRNTARILANGSLLTLRNATKKGGCTFLLSFHARSQRID